MSETLRYRCNICGSNNDSALTAITREDGDCRGCGSTLRMRAVIALLSTHFFGGARPLAEYPLRKDLRGVGLSDWDVYARALEKQFDYTNTYYHQEPRLDITDVPDARAGSCDFLISSDVFEHVAPPVSLAFAGARKLLKPGGLLVLTVPWVIEERFTSEHYPHLHDWHLRQGGDGSWRLHNRRVDGSEEVFDNLVFHGGPGTTLEMRMFSREWLLRELQDAGFHDIRIAGEPMPEAGVVWPVHWSLPMLAIA